MREVSEVGGGEGLGRSKIGKEERRSWFGFCGGSKGATFGYCSIVGDGCDGRCVLSEWGGGVGAVIVIQVLY